MEDTPRLFGLATRPEMMALLVLVVGIVAARLASLGVGALLEAMDRRAARFTTTDAALIPPTLIQLTKVFVFWLLIAGAVLLALQVMGVGGLPALLGAALTFMPRLFVAFSIIVAGHLLGLLAAHVTSGINDSWSVDSTGPRLLHVAILAVAVVMGMQHISVDISFITRLILILVGTTSAGLMLAFGLGARLHVANLLAARELARFATGDRVRIEGIAGSIVEIRRTGVDVATEEGITFVPAARIAEHGITRLVRSGDDD